MNVISSSMLKKCYVIFFMKSSICFLRKYKNGQQFFMLPKFECRAQIGLFRSFFPLNSTRHLFTNSKTGNFLLHQNRVLLNWNKKELHHWYEVEEGMKADGLEMRFVFDEPNADWVKLSGGKKVALETLICLSIQILPHRF